jgi:hypothetical protein
VAKREQLKSGSDPLLSEKFVKGSLFVYAFHSRLHDIPAEADVDRQKVEEIVTDGLTLGGFEFTDDVLQRTTDGLVVALSRPNFRDRLFQHFPESNEDIIDE